MRTIRAGRVLPAAGASPLGPTAIAIDDDGLIASVSAIDEALLSPAEAGLLVTPALCDAHDHGRGLSTLACGIADRPLEAWMAALREQPRVDPYLNAATAFARLAESGVGVVNHCHNTQDSDALLAECEAVSRAARDVGIRVAFGWPFFDRNPSGYENDDCCGNGSSPRPPEDAAIPRPALRSRARNFALIEQARAFEHGGFRLQYHPVGPQWVQDETLVAIAAASALDGRRIHMHLLETKAQRAWADRCHPRGLVRFLDEIGLLSPRLTVAHAVWLRPDECRLLAARGVGVSVNMSSNLRLQSGLPPVATMIDAGVAIGIGLDGMSLDDDQDMLREARLVGHAFARRTGEGSPLTPEMVLDGIWRVGRTTVVGEDGGGRIEANAPADLLLLDFAAMASDCLPGRTDPAMLVLGRAVRQHVIGLVIHGRDIVKDARCQGMDWRVLQRLLVAQANPSAPPEMKQDA